MKVRPFDIAVVVLVDAALGLITARDASAKGYSRWALFAGGLGLGVFTLTLGTVHLPQMRRR